MHSQVFHKELFCMNAARQQKRCSQPARHEGKEGEEKKLCITNQCTNTKFCKMTFRPWSA